MECKQNMIITLSVFEKFVSFLAISLLSSSSWMFFFDELLIDQIVRKPVD